MTAKEQPPAVISPQVRSTPCGTRTFLWGERTYVMGAVNVTPDSFSGDGLGYDVDAAVDLALRMESEGADIVDIGGESTRRYDNRPGAVPVSAGEELRRVLPVIERLTPVLGIPLSVDTWKAEVARRCLEAGASMVNDVWGVRAGPDMLRVAAEYGAPIVLMHNQVGHEYGELIPDMIDKLSGAVKEALEQGVRRENIIIDPGIGFGKVADQSIEIERRLGEFKVLGLPVLVGPSRKSHIGMVLGGLPPEERMEGTAAVVTACIAGGADMVRVHDVKQMVRVARMSDAIIRGWRPPEWGL
jgi:dihydropteroate synthase